MALPERETPASALQKISELVYEPAEDLDDVIYLLIEIRRLAEDGLNLKGVEDDSS